MQGKIIDIYVYPKAGSQGLAKSLIGLVAGKGIIGDRYYSRDGTFSKEQITKPQQEITFIESEEIHHFNKDNNCELSYGDLRRNIIIENVRLNNLVGKEFQFGELKFKGVELCEPCVYLANNVESKLLPAMIGKCGLRAQILNDGELSVGNEFSLA